MRIRSRNHKPRSLQARKTRMRRSPGITRHRAQARISSRSPGITRHRAQARISSRSTGIRRHSAQARIRSRSTGTRRHRAQARIRSQHAGIRRHRAQARISSHKTGIRRHRAQARISSTGIRKAQITQKRTRPCPMFCVATCISICAVKSLHASASRQKMACQVAGHRACRQRTKVRRRSTMRATRSRSLDSVWMCLGLNRS